MSSDTQSLELALFDFQSHASMHLNFNEGYVRTLRAAWPADRIVFHACEGHVAELQKRLKDVGNIEFHAIESFKVPFGWSRHNPIGGRWAAWQCRKVMLARVKSRALRCVALLGEDANLYAVIGRRWASLNKAPLHMILHNHLGDAVRWRSRNPFIRANDMISQVQHPLPGNVRLLALELGVEDQIVKRFPAIAAATRTYEHPLLVSEWGAIRTPRPDEKLRIGFLGNASRTKGFELFLEIARKCNPAEFEFHAIGIDAGIPVEDGVLARRPAKGGLPRAEYLAALQEMDFVCLPLSSVEYDFIASGSVTDAIAAAKPLLALRTGSLDGIAAKYGDVGYLANAADELVQYVSNQSAQMRATRERWTQNLLAIREARRPETLALTYRTLLN